MPRFAHARTPLSLALAAAVAAPLLAPAAQAGEYWREEVIEHRYERRVEHRVDPYGHPAPVRAAPPVRGFDDDGAALALGVIGGVALGAVLGTVLARPAEPVYGGPYGSPYADAYAAPFADPSAGSYADPYAGDPDIIPFEPVRPVGRLAEGRYDPRGPRCQIVLADRLDRWGEPVIVEERVCR